MYGYNWCVGVALHPLKFPLPLELFPVESISIKRIIIMDRAYFKNYLNVILYPNQDTTEQLQNNTIVN